LRWKDLERLALFQYPVRCRHCHHRTYAGFPLALILVQAGRARRAQREEQARSRQKDNLM
jgi:hypothetical protein